MVRIPLRNRHGEVIAHALVDDEDAALAEHRWYRHKAGYATRKVWLGDMKWQQFFLHREVIGFSPDDPRLVDHINRDRLDNRRANLREATHAENGQNVGSVPGTSSRYRGVAWHKRIERWQAYSKADGRIRHLGYFDREEDAGAAAAAFRAEHMPFSAEGMAA